MISPIIQQYLSFKSQKVGPVEIADVPKHLDDKTTSKFGCLKFIRKLTGPLYISLAVTEEMYNLHFLVPRILKDRAFRGIVKTLDENNNIWTKFIQGLTKFAAAELVNTDAPLANGLKTIKDPSWLPPLPTAAVGLKILEETMWVSPIHRFMATLDLSSSSTEFVEEVDKYVDETKTLIAEIRLYLEELDK